MQNRLSAYLEKFNILYDYQFGFRKFHSTSLALTEVIDCIYRHLIIKKNYRRVFRPSEGI